MDADKPVSWADLPRKKQLVVITMARMSEPLVQTSLQSYMFYQLKWFDPTLPDAAIARQAGILSASFMAAQFLTAMMWGRVADSAGRKTVLLVGLCGTCISCLGFGFASSFWQALVFRTLGGALNGNIGVMRTMISEIIREKKFQARAFLLLPMTFNIGVIIGPILGGLLSDLAGTYPSTFGNVAFFRRFPYAAPNLLSSLFLFLAAMAVLFGLEETVPGARPGPIATRLLGSKTAHSLFGARRTTSAGQDAAAADETSPLLNNNNNNKRDDKANKQKRRLPFRRIFTRNVVLTLFAQFMVVFHVGTFNSLWLIFLSTPVYDPVASGYRTSLPFRFSGGLGLPPQQVGEAMSILGVIGITLQLFCYPPVVTRLGPLRSWRIFMVLFPLVYFVTPYLSVVPSTSPPPHFKTGAAVWLSMCAVLFVRVMGRTFALPSQAILINNCSPHPSVLGTIHGLGQSVSSLARTTGPVIGGIVYGFGLSHGYVGIVFWLLAIVAICACAASLAVKEGDGHEIWLEGDPEPEPSRDVARQT